MTFSYSITPPQSLLFKGRYVSEPGQTLKSYTRVATELEFSPIPGNRDKILLVGVGLGNPYGVIECETPVPDLAYDEAVMVAFERAGVQFNRII